MKKYSYLIAIPIILALITIALFLPSDSSAKFENGKTISLEIAKTPSQKSAGLMNREELDEDAGMLFIYEEESILSFWMKDTLIPLDIIFLNNDYEIVSIKKMKPCTEDPCQSHPSEIPSKYAIEVNAGFTQENNISIGQKVTIR
jgi:uncharacterized protein